MNKKENPADISAELADLRRQIDETDNKLMALLIERTGFVKSVGELKHKNTPGICPIRPGREATMVRRIIEACKKSDFPAAGAAAIWRILIGASTSVESPLKISVFTPDRNDELSWMAREYFGAFQPITKQPHVKRVIGDVLDGKCSVGILPILRSSDAEQWWTSMVQQGPNMPKIFAHIPFVYHESPSQSAPAALAIGRIEPEPTGDDISLVVLEADQNVSQNRLQTAFSQSKLDATWIQVATIHPATRHHLLLIKGFMTPEQPELQAILTGLGNSILNVIYLGAYAVPVMLKSGNTANDQASAPHAKAAQ